MNHARRFLTPGLSNERKDRDGLNALKPSTTSKLAKPSVHRAAAPFTPKSSKPVTSNQLLAGYLAHEFLTKGTLFGEPWDLERAEVVDLSSASREKCNQKGKAEPTLKPNEQVEKYRRYAEVADLLKTDGAHMPGIVNPTQLAHFLTM
ncbi:unnamed protein product [Ilex paraguariensis]|uniref:Embryo sac development arrest 6 n=1 Tax=Ilex paraguariensis TaxID=185542 RepID=A0ABC8S2H8_9AQUA